MYDIPTKNLREISGFKETPEGWSNTTIDDLCQIGRGRVISGIEINANPGIYPVYSSQTRDQGRMGSISSYDFDGQYVTWTTDGENAGTVFFREGKFNCTNVCGTLFPKNSDVIDLKFLTYQLGEVAKSYVSYIGNPKLMNGVMGQVALIIPEKKAQQKIAHILTTVDNLIEKTQDLIDKYTAVKQGMMHDLFTRGIDLATGQLRPSYEQAPELYKETELGWVPREWDVVTLGDIAVRVGSGVTPTGGSDVYVSDGVVFLRSQNITFEGLKLNDVAYIDERTHRSMHSSEVFAFDVLINITGASIGRCCYMPEGFDAVNSNQHVCSIRFHEPTESKAIFLSQVLSAYIGQNQIHCLNAGGNREGLNYQQLRSFEIPWPNDGEITAISERLMDADKNIEINKNFMAKLQVQKKGLMQDLLTGRVRVN